MTNNFPNVVIVMARCNHNRQPFGSRFEEKARGQWLADWAFALKETAARKEGYDRNEIVGVFGFDRAYPGCPHCHAISLFKCGCGRVACWDGDRNSVTCPWCGSIGKVSGPVHSLNGGDDL